MNEMYPTVSLHQVDKVAISASKSRAKRKPVYSIDIGAKVGDSELVLQLRVSEAEYERWAKTLHS